MPILTLSDASLAFGHVALLDRAALSIEPGERVALIGRNGSGKSSLLQVLAGAARLDDGEVWTQPGLRVAHVSQEPRLDPDSTVFDAAVAGVGGGRELLSEYHALTRRLTAESDPALLERLNRIQADLEHADLWRLTSRVERALAETGLDGDARVGTLSGGGIKRLALARALAGDPELLLLDEPTNHLDLDGIAWLERLLIEFPGAVIVVTHDRRFLDNVATRIVELDRGRLASYPGRFADYQRRKVLELEAEAQQAARFDKLLAQEEVWIRKGVEARRTRNEGRVRRLEQLRRERAERRERLGSVRIAVDQGEITGRLVAELEGVSKSYEGRAVVRDFSSRILRGDKIGIVGPNGAGKTTLLKLILGQIEPDAGRVRLGTRLAPAYFDQFRTALDEDAALAEVISPGSEYVEIGGRRKHVVGYLGDFLFAPERARSPVRSLSGGERNRLLLARLFSRPANVLVLDEPTNDLDIETLELLEDLLVEFEGTVLLVSHDRTFLDNVVTQVIAAEGQGVWREYVGGYADWQRQRPASIEAPAAREKTAPAQRPAQERPAKPRISFKEARELEGLPARIEELEAEHRAAAARLADPALYRDRPGEVAGLKQRLADLEAEIDQAMARWEELERVAGK